MNDKLIEWHCNCGNIVLAKEYPYFPKWSDGHECTFTKKT